MPDTTTTRPAEIEQPRKVEITRAGFERLKQQLAQLRTVERPALTKRIQQAALFLPPNVARDVAGIARYDLTRLDAQIAALEREIAEVVVVEPPPGSEVVQVGSRVTVRYEDESEGQLTVVGPWEANGSGGQVANDSFFGQALLGKRPGDRVTASGDGASIDVQIVSVTAASAAD